MSRKRLLLIESGQFLGGVIRNLFTSCEQFEVLAASPTTWRKLLVAVNEAQPDVIIMDDTLGKEYLSNLLIHMQNSKAVSIIIVNTNSNQIQMYQKQNILLQQSQDFFAML